MIEVIKNLGRKRVECKECRSILVYNPADLVQETSEEGVIMNDYIICPVCDCVLNRRDRKEYEVKYNEHFN